MVNSSPRQVTLSASLVEPNDFSIPVLGMEIKVFSNRFPAHWAYVRIHSRNTAYMIGMSAARFYKSILRLFIQTDRAHIVASRNMCQAQLGQKRSHWIKHSVKALLRLYRSRLEHWYDSTPAHAV